MSPALFAAATTISVVPCPAIIAMVPPGRSTRAAIRAAARLAIDAGEYERARALVDLLRNRPSTYATRGRTRNAEAKRLGRSTSRDCDRGTLRGSMSFTNSATHPFRGSFLACAAIVACAPATHPTAPIPLGPAPAVTGAAAAVNRFGFELYDAMRDRPGNLVVAPLGAATALAQVALATGGDTRAAIARVLHSSPDDEALGAYATLVDAVNAQDATGGFLFRVLPQVSTDGAGTRLTSAMRLRMKTWAPPFFAEQADFSTPTGPACIHYQQLRSCQFAFAQVDGVRLLEMPSWECPTEDPVEERQCDVTGYAILLVLPDDPADLRALGRRAVFSYERWMARLALVYPDVRFPDVTPPADLDLGSALRAMGVPWGRQGLADATQHLEYDASFAQDQLGHDDTRCKPGQIDGTFDADRPFLHIIRDRPTGVVLFVGRVVDPR